MLAAKEDTQPSPVLPNRMGELDTNVEETTITVSSYRLIS